MLIPASAMSVMAAGPPPLLHMWGATEITDQFMCALCRHIYPGEEEDPADPPFTDLPLTWQCPGTSCEGEKKDYIPDTIGDVYFVTTTFRNKKLTPTMFHFELDSEGDILKFSSNSIASPEGWGNWELDILPNLRRLAVSCVSGFPRIVGWSDSTLSNETFFPDTPGKKDSLSIERTVSSAAYGLFEIAPKDSGIQHYTGKAHILQTKTNFSSLNKKIRHQHASAKPLPALSNWTPSTEDLEIHQNKIIEGHLSVNAPCVINWGVRFKFIINCPYIGPKYRQLIYWIATNTLCTGKQLKFSNPRGYCPHCEHPDGTRVTADWQHMFFKCTTAQTIWMEVDMKGHLHWGEDYEPLKLNDVPVILSEYKPQKLLQLSALWAMWVHWCKYFHQGEDFTYEDRWDWTNLVLLNTMKQFKTRMHEAHSAVQWILIVQNRRLRIEDRDPHDTEVRIPEKQFLLTHSWGIQTNADNININGKIPPQLEEWIGGQYLVTLDLRDGDHLTPKMKFNLHPWDQYGRPPDHTYPDDYGAGPWSIAPRNCLCDY